MNMSTKARFAIQALATCSLLAACATVPAKIVYQQVPMAVSGTCIPATLPKAPETQSLADLAAMDGPNRYVAVTADLLTLKAWVAQAAPVVEACR